MRELMAQLMENGLGRIRGETTPLKVKITPGVLTVLTFLCLYWQSQVPGPKDEGDASRLISGADRGPI